MIWKDRNAEIHGEKRKPASVIVSGIRQYIDDYNKAQLLELRGCQQTQAKWLHPPLNAYKVNFDGAFKASTKTGGIKVVIRDVDGNLMGSKIVTIHEATDPFIVEATATVQALEFASNLRFQKIILEGDALSIVKMLKNNNPYLTNTGHLIK